jgi:integral membrane protein (TIGR01906 family)
LRRAAVVGIALLVPFVLVANGVHALVRESFVRWEYSRPHLPPDPEGMPKEERVRLALVGLDSILPWERDGLDRLRAARLEDGSTAFDEREVRHMQDVRTIVWILFVLHAAGLALFLALGLARRTRPLLRQGLRLGAAVTLGLAAFVGIVMLLNPVWFLTGFHTIFFEGSSWRFADEDTLRRLFPDRFWSDVAVIVGVAATLQAALLLVAASWPELRPRLARLRAGAPRPAEEPEP